MTALMWIALSMYLHGPSFEDTRQRECKINWYACHEGHSPYEVEHWYASEYDSTTAIVPQE